MNWPFTPCAPDSASATVCLAWPLAPAVYRVRFRAVLYPLLALSDDQHSSPTATREVAGNGDAHSHPQIREGQMPHREFRRPLPLLSVLLGVREGTVPLPPVSTAGAPPTSAWIHASAHGSELVTPVSDEAARGPSGCIAVECGRRRASALHRRRRCSLAFPIGISTAFDTVGDGRVLAVLCGLPRLCRCAQRW
ncbi:hypothetical protein TcBrA4_0099590 [Trypanosoma cruzi]|nr:hypothetical protein TcBrA4_0099590 [Trypanosoma cruzi]